MEKIKPYILLMRPNYQINFIEVLLGVLFVLPAVNQSLSGVSLKILLLFLCFALFYGGIYALNDVVDMEDDKKDDRKKYRVLPSGQISRLNGLIFGIFLILSGIFLANRFLEIRVAAIFLVFLAINILYTFLLKRVPYVELLVNCLTHPLRLVLGASLLGGTIPFSFLVAFFFFTVGLGVKIRLFMMENNGVVSRPSLRHYTKTRIKVIRVILLIILLGFAIFDKAAHTVWYLALLFLYIAFVFDLSLFNQFSKFFRTGYMGRDFKV